MVGVISIKRVYEPAAVDDGTRVLVDRLWPRGVSKEEAKYDFWLKDVAPSTDLRHWFGHDPARWEEFRRRYVLELDANPAVAELASIVKKGHTTVLYGAHDEEHNQAVVLADYLRSRL